MVDIIIVIGTQNSSYSSRLSEVSEKSWTTAYMSTPGCGRFGRENTHRVTDGAGAPEVLVQILIDLLKECGAKSVRTLEGVKERVTFPLPKGLSKLQIAGNAREPNACLLSVPSNSMQDVVESKLETDSVVSFYIMLK